MHDHEKKGKKILVVDDYEGILMPIKIALTHEGYQVSSTQDGDEVITKAMAELPDLLLMDILLAGVDGRDVVKSLKENPLTAGIRIVLMSANSKFKNAALETGADDFIEKPFDIDQLLNKLEKNLINTLN
jgi:DNA-binding response OmpR family regulator